MDAEVGSRARASDGSVGTMLWRRVDPIPDEVTLGGGVVFPVVEGVVALSIEAFDGEAWAASWDSDRDGPTRIHISEHTSTY